MFRSQTQIGPKEDDPDAGITSIDYEEQNAGYQVAYSKLAASETSRPDPVAYAGDAKQYLFKQLAEAVRRSGSNTWRALIAQCDPGIAGPFIQEYGGAGFSL